MLIMVSICHVFLYFSRCITCAISIIAKCDLLHYYYSIFFTVGQEMDHFDMKVRPYAHRGRAGYTDECSVNQSSKK